MAFLSLCQKIATNIWPNDIWPKGHFSQCHLTQKMKNGFGTFSIFALERKAFVQMTHERDALHQMTFDKVELRNIILDVIRPNGT
jgi:hypothetical protein